MRYLSIDYGDKRVGIAISDVEGNMAFPHSVIPNPRSIKILLQNIKNIIEQEGVEAVVVGESKDFQGVDNNIMIGAKKFVEILKSETDLGVFWEPEFLTSHQAEKIQGKNDMSDASAASIILQSFLDKRKNGV